MAKFSDPDEESWAPANRANENSFNAEMVLVAEYLRRIATYIRELEWSTSDSEQARKVLLDSWSAMSWEKNVVNSASTPSFQLLDAHLIESRFMKGLR